jgi:hypothetical protein
LSARMMVSTRLALPVSTGSFGVLYVMRVAVHFEDVGDVGEVEATKLVVAIVLGIECRKAADAFENRRIGLWRQ